MMQLPAISGQGWWWLHPVIFAGVAFVSAVISLAIFARAIRYWLIRWDPEQVRKRRYAQGDADREGYERALTDLQR